MQSELSVLFRRRRTWAMLTTISMIPIFLAIAVKLSGSTLPPGEGPPFLDRVSQNGMFVGFTAMILAIPLFLPLTIGVVAGDTIAGEANTGTLRYLLVAPVSRTRLLIVKFLGASAFALAATFTLMITGIAIGAILFPIGPVTLLSGDVISIPAALVRIFLVAIYVTISLMGLTAIGLFISTLTVIPVGAMAATVVVSTVTQILGTLPQLAVIHPYLISYYWLGFADLLRNPISLGSFASNTLLQLAYIAIFGSLAYGRFTTKDVLS
ncbi:MAG: ABC transporter permease [Candidatus Planktophila sp.]|nr:ABC transporter permease [Candidatus Planktophila sp.]MSO25088.1 ABC transporter permease [Candidatus Planktophila sp.]